MIAGRIDDAEAQWRQALTENPQFVPALYGAGRRMCGAP
jgi:hypothetical protein